MNDRELVAFACNRISAKRRRWTSPCHCLVWEMECKSTDPGPKRSTWVRGTDANVARVSVKTQETRIKRQDGSSN